MVSALAPLLMAAALIYAPVLFGGRPNYLFGLFTVLSPVMVVASYLESRRSGRLQHQAELTAFRQALFEAEIQLEAALAAEKTERLRAAPAVGELGGLIDQLSPRLWERGSTDPDVLTVRVGLAHQPSLVAVQRPDRGEPGLRAEADAVADRFAVVGPVPALADLGAGGLGISGPVDHALPLGFAVVAQLATLHTPAELVLAALVPSADAARWDWMKWLPHCPIDVGPLPGPVLAASEVDCRRVMAELNALIAQRLALRLPADAPRPLPLVVVVVVEGVPVEQHELTHLLEHGPAAGVYTLWMAGASRRVPRPVATVVDVAVTDGERPVATLTPPSAAGPPVSEVAVEGATGVEAASLARRLAPLTDAGSQVARAAEIPVPGRPAGGAGRPGHPRLPGGGGGPVVPPHPVPGGAGGPDGHRGVVARPPRATGPTRWSAGTTGAGKSELLQTLDPRRWPPRHSPDARHLPARRLQGRRRLRRLRRLPHTVGLVTDLDAAPGPSGPCIARGRAAPARAAAHANDGAKIWLERWSGARPGAPPSLRDRGRRVRRAGRGAARVRRRRGRRRPAGPQPRPPPGAGHPAARRA